MHDWRRLEGDRGEKAPQCGLVGRTMTRHPVISGLQALPGCWPAELLRFESSASPGVPYRAATAAAAAAAPPPFAAAMPPCRSALRAVLDAVHTTLAGLERGVP